MFVEAMVLTCDSQQHGSVYWDGAAPSLLHSLDATQPLACQLVPEAFSTVKCPIWQDSSTTEECKIIENAIGGAQQVSDITGSKAYERFTGAQILKVGNIVIVSVHLSYPSRCTGNTRASTKLLSIYL